jgi:hypothetical protein
MSSILACNVWPPARDKQEAQGRVRNLCES